MARVHRLICTGALWLAMMTGLGSLAAVPAHAEKVMDLATFLVTYRCGVVNRLQALHANTEPAMKEHRWLAITRDGGDQSYVQCMFNDDSRQMWCEAASGYYSTGPDEPRKIWLSLPVKASLSALGFDTSIEKGNYPRYIDTVRSQDIDAAADLLLSALYLAYGARDTTPITLTAARGLNVRLQPCAPIS